MKPTSPHWADTTAIRIIKTREEKDTYVLASGITPSGKVHVGNFREVITVDLVARAIESLGKQVRFIYSWDNFDTFRKVPKNLPNPESFEPYLRKPIARIPDPWGQSKSYAQGRIELFEKELAEVGIKPEYLYQEQRYASGLYASEIRKALENKEKIKDILNQHRTSPLAEDWLPTSIYCSKCEKDHVDSQTYDGGWKYSYKCSCGFAETVDLRETKNLKLSWRIDWPMRWHFEKVDFEPGGKDHSSQGGSYDTGKTIVKDIWDREAPTYLQYDFVKIKGGAGKMSSSSGELYTLAEVLEVYEPEIVRWIFASQRPNHDFSLAFDEDVIKIYDEYDRSEQLAFTPCPAKPGKWPMNRRVYELAQVSSKLPSEAPKRASFRVLCNRLQICDGNAERTFERFYKSEISDKGDVERFFLRAKKAKNWLQSHAPEEFKYAINPSPVSVTLNPKQEQAILAFKDLIESLDLDSIEPKALNDAIWEKVIHATEADPKEVFKAIYQKLISRNQGPRLPSFLKEIGQERILGLI